MGLYVFLNTNIYEYTLLLLCINLSFFKNNKNLYNFVISSRSNPLST